MKSNRFGILALLALVPIVACSGGGNDAAGGQILPPPVGGGSGTLTGDFVADKPNPDAENVTVRQEAANSNFVTLQVNVTAVLDIYSAGFDLTFDPTLVEFTNWSPGTLFEFDGNTPLYTVAVTSGRLTVGATRSGAVDGANVQATRTIIKLTFAMLREGGARVDFENAFLLDSEPPAPGAIGGIEWYAGRFDIAPSGE